MSQASEDIPRVEATYQWLRLHPFEVDSAAAALAALAMLFIALVGGPVTISWLPTIVMVGALAWRRRRPLRSALAVAAAGFVVMLSAESMYLLVATLAVFCSLYAVTAYGPRWAGWTGAVIAWLAGGVTMSFQGIISGGADTPFALTFTATVLFGIWALGRMRRLRLRDEARLEERARLLESEAEQQAQLAATAERARIAREMHDVVAHSLSVTISQADGGRYAAQHNPEAAITALETISATGRQALADMRALLGVLRDDSTQQLTPQPDTEAIKDLVDQVRGSGLTVTLEVLGEPVVLPAGPGLAAYRIVQESLTNVLKHAGPSAEARVRLMWLSEALEIRVEDDGRGAAATPATPGSQGLIGMRERATLYGGQLEAGPRQGGGFGVRAYLPYRQNS
ncbi:two-component sensor histidine kinase [Kineosporia sp. NBRC 101677]|uniref:sensor histidine kinase n=1 Tax=Kineosporia sp. NBRC 101677 TaxID=3032197 RepID=UPI0024A2192E|nr:sensor histidine kinase [Kineosporia sp. NBRC 101677]GLY13554.1 two-component sensor histidine kinase [Kineosporia sp. NBRC 101677]